MGAHTAPPRASHATGRHAGAAATTRVPPFHIGHHSVLVSDVDDDPVGPQWDAAAAAGWPAPGQEFGFGAGGGFGPPWEWRLRHQLVPFAVVGLLWSAGAGLAALGPAGGGLLAAAVGAGFVAAVVLWCRQDLRRPGSWAARRRWAATVAASAAGWLVCAGVAGPGGWRGAVLVLAGWGLALPYWRRHTLPVPDEPGEQPAPAAPALVVAEPAPHEVVARWAERVAVAEGALPGSYLHSYTRRGPAESWVVELDPVRQTADMALARLARLCGALGRPATAVAVDLHPSGNPAQAVLLVTDPADSPIQRGVAHPGPAGAYDPRTGWARIGVHPDGEPAQWRLWVPGWGVPCGFVVGETGSGKSVLLTGLAATAMHTGVFSVWAACPQGGASFPQLVKHSVWPVATTTEDLLPVLAQLRALETAINVRGLLNGLREQSLHTPTPEEPALLWIGDEFHELTKEGGQVTKAAVAAIDTISREGRKCAVAVVGASQYGGVKTFGNQDQIRMQMFARNAVALRSTSNTSKTLMQGMDVDPKHIPELPGAGYLKGRRTALFRAYYSPDEYAADLAAAPKTEPDPALAAAMGTDWAGRAELRLRKRVEAAERLRLLDPATVERIAAADPALAAALAAQARGEQAGLRRTTIGLHQAPQPARAPAARTTDTGAVLRAAGLPTLPTAPRWTPPTQHPTPEPSRPPAAAGHGAGPAVLGIPAAGQLYELIRAGTTRTGALIAQTGYSESHVRNTLGALADAGLITRIAHGTWAPTAA